MGLGWFQKIAAWLPDILWNRINERMWNCLPDTALVEIYLCLQDRDRVNMALTCKSWYKVFAYPCLWRTRYIDLGGYRAKSAGERACKFANQHGAHIRYLFLSCNHPSSHTCRIIQGTIEEFLEKIRSAELIHFELERLNLNRFWKYENLKEKVVNSFANFFSVQRHLVEFDMLAAHFSMTSGCKILEAVGSASGSTVKDLDIEDFFHARLAVFQVKRFRNALARFTNLSYISLNYNCLSDDIFENMAKHLAGKLKNISCKIYRTDPHFHRISPFSWKKLKTVCPELSIDFWFEGIGMSSDTTRILVPGAPVRKIHMWTGYDDSAEWRLSETINHIANYHKQIKVLSMELDNNNETIDASLVTLVKQCKALRELYINAIVTVSAIDEICVLQTEGKINLQTFHVTTCGLTLMECVELMYIKDKHLPVMEEKGLNFRITSDYLSDMMS